jgi:RHS repeat-associated protein
MFDHTDGINTGPYKNAQKLTGAEGSVLGSVITLPVKAGDKVSAEVFAMYSQPTGTDNPLAAVGDLLISALAGGMGTSANYEGMINNSYGSSGSMLSNDSYNYDVDDTEPKAFINLLFMPENASNMVAEGNFAYKQIGAASNGQHAVMALDEAFEAPATGYVVVYLSNESSQYTEVYFDDLEVSIEQGHVIQSTDYYPFGGQQATSWTRVSAQDNLRLYNAGSELNKLTQNYETFYRQYDPMLGRFHGIDIKAVKYANQSPYQFAGNNPVSNNDPMGDDYNPPPPARHIPGHAGAHEGGIPRGAGNGSGFFGFGGPIGPGSGNHWSDAFSNPYRDYFLMSNGDFDAKYGAPGGGRRFDLANDLATPAWLAKQQSYFHNTGNRYEWYEVIEGGVGKGTDLSNQNGGNDGLGLIADLFRYTPNFGIGNPNPFFGAEAIYIDGGVTMVGAEADKGYFFILVGEEKGSIVAFSEIAGGVATDAGFGIEIGRVDVTGNPNDFKSSYLFGFREKVWGSISPTGEIVSLGGAFSWGEAGGEQVTTSSVQIGVGISPVPFIFGPGYNQGEIRK